jgi:hypothetical protein
MAFRCGNQGPSMWPHCLKLEVAAITYDYIDETDLSKYPPGEPKELWDELAPTQKSSLRRLAYEMKQGDTIYVKDGSKIVGRGTVKGQYKYDYTNAIQDPYGNYWHHQLPVKWEPNFVPVPILLGAEQHTVKPLKESEVKTIDQLATKRNRELLRLEALEGERVKAEATFRSRNRGIILAKKAISDGSCEICEFRFENRYGILGKDCLVAHHLNPIGRRRKAIVTKMEDILLVCPNCHAVAHNEIPPVVPSKLTKMLRKCVQQCD